MLFKGTSVVHSTVSIRFITALRSAKIRFVIINGGDRIRRSNVQEADSVVTFRLDALQFLVGNDNVLTARIPVPLDGLRIFNFRAGILTNLFLPDARAVACDLVKTDSFFPGRRYAKEPGYKPCRSLWQLFDCGGHRQHLPLELGYSIACEIWLWLYEKLLE